MEYTSNMGLNWQTLEMYPMVERISGIIDEIFIKDLSCRGPKSFDAKSIMIAEAEKLFLRDIKNNKELPEALITNVRRSLDNVICYANRSKTLSD